jgi:hypothetical protein
MTLPSVVTTALPWLQWAIIIALTFVAGSHPMNCNLKFKKLLTIP